MANIGDSYFIPSGPKDHLHIIVWGLGLVPFRGAGDQFILASVASLVPQHDPACIVKQGDHPFIQHDSYVFYRAIKAASDAHIQAMVQNKYWVPAQSASPQLIAKIRAGFCTSLTVERRYKSVLGCPNPPPPPP